LIPHRDPFLFVDRVLECDGQTLVAEWDVSPHALFFGGHYPGNPIVPGVLLNEFVFQSAAIFMSLPGEGAEPPAGFPVLTRIDQARFKRMVRPGETLRADLTLNERLGPACYMKAKVSTGEATVLRLSFVVAMTPAGARS